ncbi:MAG: hypothetical protein ACYCSJ_00840 [Acidimicrobiales bacterium]
MSTPAHVAVARNAATRSDNRIHEDTVAKTYGFSGGLVPGVTLYGYLIHPVVAHFGLDWLARGTAEVRFARPVYEGGRVEAFLDPTAEPVGGGEVSLSLVDAEGTTCVTGTAGLPAQPAPVFAPASVAWAQLPEERPAADAESLAPGRVLGSLFAPVEADHYQGYLDILAEDPEPYRRAGLAHPGALILSANTILAANVRLGPWVHVGSRVANLAPVPRQAEVETRARVRYRYERKGHQLVELEVVWLHQGEPVMTALHTAIYQLREQE